MRNFKASCLATLLVLAFSVPVLAGDISSPGITTTNPPTTTEPQPDPQDPGIIATIYGDISSPGMLQALYTALSVF